MHLSSINNSVLKKKGKDCIYIDYNQLDDSLPSCTPTLGINGKEGCGLHGCCLLLLFCFSCYNSSGIMQDYINPHICVYMCVSCVCVCRCVLYLYE